jgi:hypothetical protein
MDTEMNFTILFETYPALKKLDLCDYQEEALEDHSEINHLKEVEILYARMRYFKSRIGFKKRALNLYK